MFNAKHTDPTITELASGWNDVDLCDVYRMYRIANANRNQWSAATIVAVEETLAYIRAELHRRGLGWVDSASADGHLHRAKLDY